MRQCGIYQIICSPEERSLIGASRNIGARWRMHLYQLRRGRHANADLSRAWARLQKGDFKLSVLETVKPERLRGRLAYWIQELRADDPARGYNKPLPGAVPPALVVPGNKGGAASPPNKPKRLRRAGKRILSPLLFQERMSNRARRARWPGGKPAGDNELKSERARLAEENFG